MRKNWNWKSKNEGGRAVPEGCEEEHGVSEDDKEDRAVTQGSQEEHGVWQDQKEVEDEEDEAWGLLSQLIKCWFFF